MSITDKLPKAPEGYSWKSRVSVTSDNTQIYLRLDPDYSAPIVPRHLGGSLDYAFVEPTEEAVIGAANRIIKGMEDNKRLDSYLKAKTAEASEVYSDLLTGE